MIQQFFNVSAFVSPTVVPRGVYGSSGRNIISGPATNRTDASLMKDMVIREQLRLQLRGEFFNTFNHAQFSNPTTAASAPNFGQISTTSVSPRIIQLALKYLF